MLERARRGILLVDHSKFEQARYELVCPLAELADLVTNASPPAVLAAAIGAAGVTMHLALDEPAAGTRPVHSAQPPG